MTATAVAVAVHSPVTRAQPVTRVYRWDRCPAAVEAFELLGGFYPPEWGPAPAALRPVA